MTEFECGECRKEAPLCFGEGDGAIEVCYHSNFAPHHDLILLDLPHLLLPEVLHQRVTLRGEPDEDAVLCTSSNTYALKTVATSNSVLLIPPTHSPLVAPVIKLVSHTLELSHVAPRLDKLRNLLRQRPYNPLKDSRPNDLYSWEDLVRLVQASDEELKSGLLSVSALEIDGCWGIVDPQYMDSMLSIFLSNSVLNDWSFKSLVEDDVLSALISDGFCPNLALHCLRVFAREVPGSDLLWMLDEKRVCVHLAHQILQNGSMKLEHFMREWSRKVPDGINPSFDILDGEVLSEKVGIETRVRSFSVSSLPVNPADRFSILFKECPKWRWTDLQPYIRDLSVPGLSSEGLLMKFARKTQPSLDAEPIYSAR